MTCRNFLFDFSRYLGVNSEIIDKKTSADLWEGQSDEDDLGYSYKELDSFLKLYIDENRSQNELKKAGFDDDFFNKISKRVKINSFKRELPKIAKI